MADWDVVSQQPASAGADNAPTTDWTPVSQAPVGPPALMRTMPDFKSENDYQGWVRQHLEEGSSDFSSNSASQSTTVDPYGNGSTVDLRRMYADNAAPSPITGQNELEPDDAMMDKYQMAHSPTLTKDSIYAGNSPASAIGSWSDPDEDGQRTWQPPGWTPASDTKQAMDKAVKLATGTGKDITSAVSSPDFFSPEKTLDNAEDTGLAALKGMGGDMHGLQEDVNIVGGAFPVLYDKAKSLFTGKDTTDAQDAWFASAVDPLKSQDDAFDLAKNAGLPEKVAHEFGSMVTSIDLAVLTGGESAPLEAGASGMDALKAAAEHGTKSMAIPATQSAIDTGRKVYEETGDGAQALKAAQMQWLVTSAGGYVPLSGAGSLPSRLAQGAVAGTASSETGRQVMNTALPQSMQQDFDPSNIPGEAAAGAVMGGMGGHAEPAHPDYQGGGPEHPDNLADNFARAGQQPPGGPAGSAPGLAQGADWTTSDGIYKTFRDAMNAHKQGDSAPANATIDRLHTEADNAEAAGDHNRAQDMRSIAEYMEQQTGGGNATSAAGKRTAQDGKTALISMAARDAGDIKAEASDDGATVTVSGRRVADFQSEGAANRAVDDARQAVEDRRVDDGMRKKVGDMTPDEMRKEMLTHELTGLPNRRAFDEDPRMPGVVSIDANSLKWINDEGGHEAGDHLLKAIGTALQDESPHSYHLGGDEFALQAKTPEEAEASIQRVKQRLAGAKIEMVSPTGHKITVNGIGISHGTGSDFTSADRALQHEKSRQATVGLRAARGEQPPGTDITAPEAGLPGQQDNAAHPASVLGQSVERPAQPTPAQAKAGNYKKADVQYHGLPIKVENVEGQYRTGTNAKGQVWKNRMKGADYGYFKGTKANDGDGVDVFMGKQGDTGKAYVIDQVKPDKSFDEHKVVVGVNSTDEADKLYHAHYQKGWKGFGGITELSNEDLAKWLKAGDHSRPLNEQSVAKPKIARGLGPDARHDSVLQYLARHPKGLNSQEAVSQGIDPADMALAAAHVGIKRAFRKGGMSFDHAAETLHQEGYPVADEQGHYSPNVLLDKISDELRGKPQYSTRNESHIPEATDLEGWRHAKTDDELEDMTPADLEKLHADLEAAAERAAIQREEQPTADSHLDDIPFAKGDDFSLSAPGGRAGTQPEKPKKGGEQQDLFGDKVAIKNEIERVKAALDKKRNSGQVSAETGKTDDLFSQAAKQADLVSTPVKTPVKKGEETGQQMDLATEADKLWSPLEPLALMQRTPAELHEYIAGALERHMDREAKEGEAALKWVSDQAAIEKAYAEKRPTTEYGKKLLASAGLQDAGEKIGGARKDKWAERGLRLTDLDSMTEGEAAEYVNKKAVFNPDWQKMIDGGMPREVAAVGKILVDQLAARPRNNTPTGRRDYVEVLSKVRDMVTAAKSLEDLKGLHSKLVQDLGVPTGYALASTPEQQRAREKYWSIQKGRRSTLSLHNSDIAKAKRLITEGWPQKEAWAKRFEIGGQEGRYVLRDRKTGSIDWAHSFDTMEMAKEAAQNRIDHEEAAAEDDARAGIKAEPEKPKEPSRPHLERIERIGPPVREGDATPQQFVDHFGFRGLEFGNWAANDERQGLLNHAYDALEDLARALELPPKALSLNGTMGLALAARGGGKAAAHYESHKLVINMTKLRGAGALAHEWGHALDHYMGEFGRADAYQGVARGATGWRNDPTSRTLAHLRPEMQQAWNGVMEAMFKKQQTHAEFVRDLELGVEKAKSDLRAVTDAIKERPDDKLLPTRRDWLTRRIEASEQHLEEVRKEDPSRTYSAGPSDYIKTSQDLGKYWRRPNEMFARAFESFVQDKLAAASEKSQYLVHGTEGTGYPQADRPHTNAAIQRLVDTLDTRSEGGKEVLFKQGAGAPAGNAHLEASAIASRVKQLLDQFKVPVGGVRVADSMAELLKDPEIGPVLEAAGATADNRDKRIAFVHPRTQKLYFIADQIHSLDHVASLVAHEYITHFGLRAALGDARNPAYQAILDGVGKALPGELADRGRRYFGHYWNPNDRTMRNEAAEEALASYSEAYSKGQTVPDKIRRWLDKLHAMIRDWLRKTMGLPKKFDELFIKRTLADLETFLRNGGETAKAGVRSQEPAFAGQHDTFYSGLAKAVDAAKREKGTGAEWEATLRNMPGVKAEELEWTGIKDWLAGQGKVSKQQVADYVAAHRVNLGEVNYGGGGGDTERLLYEIRQLGYHVDEDVHGNPELVEAPGADHEIDLDTSPAEQDRANDAKYSQALALVQRLKQGDNPHPQYRDWATPGGSNYREMLMTLPHSEDTVASADRLYKAAAEANAAHADTRAAERKFLDFLPEGAVLRYNAIHWLWDANSTDYPFAKEARDKLVAAVKAVSPAFRSEAAAAMREGIRQNMRLRTAQEEQAAAQKDHKTPPATFKSNHWEVDNVLAHMRFDDREGPNGEKILHVHEIQSDWHQMGRKKGYMDGDTPAQLKRLQETRDALIQKIKDTARPQTWEEKPDRISPGQSIYTAGELNVFHDDLAHQGPSWRVTHRGAPLGGGFKTAEDAMAMVNSDPTYGTPDPKLTEELNAVRRDIQLKRDEIGTHVANAPFKTTWPELAMKRMLRMAVEGGYDKLSWDTGDTNADRYNMQAVVDAIHIGHVGDEKDPDQYHLIAQKDGSTVREENYITEQRMADLVGKEIARQAVSETRSVGKKATTLRGASLKIGGTGMRGFYDEILPKKMQAIVKKWGSSVEPGQVGGANRDEMLDNSAQILSNFASEQGWSAAQVRAGDSVMRIIDSEGKEVLPPMNSELGQALVAHNALANTREPPAIPVHTVAITDKMRDSVMGGQPMFAKGDVDDRRTKDPERDTLFGREGAGGTTYGMVRRGAAATVDNELVRSFTRIVNPRDVSDVSKQAASLTRAFLGELAHQKTVAQEHLQQFTRSINRLSQDDQLAMIHAIETGAPQPIPGMQPIADAMRKMLDTWRDHVRSLGTGNLENYIENYFPHWWKDQPKAKSVFASIQGRRTMSGPKTFLKKRTIPTTKEGIEYGLTPITTNPLVLTLLKINEMQRYVSGVSMLRGYKDTKTAEGGTLAEFLPTTKSTPEGWKEIDDPIARVSSWSEAEGGFVQRGRYIMPTDAARIVNNHLSASKLANFMPAQIIRSGANILNAMQLGFSAFHLGFTTLDAMISKNAIALERLASGEPLRALTAFGEGMTPVGAAMNIARGIKLMNAYTNPSGATPEMKQLVNALTAAGGRVHMDRFYLANEGVSPFRGVGPRSLAADMKQALTQPHGKMIAATKAIGSFPVDYAQQTWNSLAELGRIYPAWQWPLELVGRTTRASSAWIMEHIVPMQKLGVFSDMAQDWLRRNPDATPDEMTKAMQNAWDSVDNRLGEMVYDNLFWDRTFKDATHLAVRAVGWNAGTIREIGGAPQEVLQNVSDAIRDGKMPKLGHKAAYVMSLYMTTALLGAVVSYFYGTKPKELKDYLFPRTGRFQADGTPERISFPSYVKDVYEYANHPGQTLMHKANPWIGVLNDEITNTDYFGHPIYNATADEMTQWRERMEYVGKAFRPFSWSGQKNMVGSEDPGLKGLGTKVLPYVGVTPAPALITKPEKMEQYQHYQDQVNWKKKLQFDLKKARATGDKAAVQDIQRQLNEMRPAELREHNEYLRDKAKTKKEATAGKTSALLDHVGPLIDSSSSRAEMAQKIHAAGYPALAGLIGSLPETLRPQVADAIERNAT